jgi:hypothetical protein
MQTYAIAVSSGGDIVAVHTGKVIPPYFFVFDKVDKHYPAGFSRLVGNK